MADEKKGFAAMFEAQGATKPTRTVRAGEEITGTIVALNDETAFVDLGAKSEGILDRSELVDDEGKGPAVGDTIKAHVASTKGGQIVLRTRMGKGDDAEELRRAFESRIPVQGKVSGVNKGGLEIEIGGVRGFCPMSQIDIARVEDPGSWIGRELEFRITKFEEGRGRPDIVLSRRDLLEEQRAKLADATRASLEVGAVVRGTVTRIVDFGAFVDLGGLEGLLHKSQLGFGRVDHPNQVLSVGDVVEAQVTKMETTDDPRRPDRISLSLKALQNDPFEQIHGKLGQGAIVKGKVVRLEPFGAFVAVEDGVEGLVHISEMADRHVNHPRDVVSVGDEVEVTVLEIDEGRRRLSLSMKQVARKREQGRVEQYKGSGGQSLGTFGDLLKDKLKK
jgi:small subunit ribosomal protein S1